MSADKRGILMDCTWEENALIFGSRTHMWYAISSAVKQISKIYPEIIGHIEVGSIMLQSHLSRLPEEVFPMSEICFEYGHIKYGHRMAAAYIFYLPAKSSRLPNFKVASKNNLIASLRFIGRFWQKLISRAPFQKLAQM